MPKKFTITNDILKLKNKIGLYALLPYELLDSNKKAIFKIGMVTKNELSSRLENYHTYYPLGVYICFFLELKQNIREMEKNLMKELVKNGAQQMKFESRLKPTEWFYTDENQLMKSFSNIHQMCPESILHDYHMNMINTIGNKNIYSKKDKYIGKIVYFL